MERYVREFHPTATPSKCWIIQTGDNGERWTLATFHGQAGQDACDEIVRLLNAHAVHDDRLPGKWFPVVGQFEIQLG